MFINLLKRLLKEESGQGITEYGAILAFVAVLVALLFGLAQGALQNSIRNAFSSVEAQLNALAAAAS